MLGFILFTFLVLLFGFILIQDNILSFAHKKNAILMKIEHFTLNTKFRVILSIFSIIIGIWNLFAPDFGATNSPTIVGALIPSIIMIANGFILYPELIAMTSMSEPTINKFIKTMTRFRFIAGPVTIIAGILHMFFSRSLLF